MIFAAKAQTDGDAVVKALKSGSAEQVAGYFDSFIDLKLPEKDEVKSMGKNQAGIALKSFFNESGVKGFDLSSQREMSGTMYIAGKLQNNGKGNGISLRLKKQGDKILIISIRIND
jgi:hypothetical protein